MAIATQLILSALGTAVGLTVGTSETDANAVGIGVGIWSIVSLLIALFIGNWITAAGCSPMNKKTALLHELILWATTLDISAWLSASGVSGYTTQTGIVHKYYPSFPDDYLWRKFIDLITIVLRRQL